MLSEYKKLSDELDGIVTKLQSSDVDLDKAVGLYDRGMEITKKLDKMLAETKNKITKMNKKS